MTVRYTGQICRAEFRPAYRTVVYKVSNTKCRIDTVFSPDDGHIVAPKHAEKSNKYIKKIFAPIWFCLQEYGSLFCNKYTKTYFLTNVEKRLNLFIF